jgi:hypothetical protein
LLPLGCGGSQENEGEIRKLVKLALMRGFKFGLIYRRKNLTAFTVGRGDREKCRFGAFKMSRAWTSWGGLIFDRSFINNSHTFLLLPRVFRLAAARGFLFFERFKVMLL